MRVIITRGAYGFGHDWTLEVYGRQYYLGQDVKFCSRILGVSPSVLVNLIGGREIESPKINRNLARIICKELNIKRSTKINVWEL